MDNSIEDLWFTSIFTSIFKSVNTYGGQGWTDTDEHEHGKYKPIRNPFGSEIIPEIIIVKSLSNEISANLFCMFILMKPLKLKQ